MGNGEVDSNPKGLLASEASLLKIAFPILGQTVRHLELLSKYHMWPVLIYDAICSLVQWGMIVHEAVFFSL